MIAIPINDPVRIYRHLQPEIDTAVAKVLSSGRWIDGPFTEQFAADFARWCGVAHCIPVGNGTDALELALRALGVEIGDEVITVANAGGFATAACRLVGATPVWIDVRADSLSIDPNWVVKAVGKRTKVIIATHLYGILADVSGIRRALEEINRNDVRILEDCAQAHGAAHGERMAGTFGDVAAFSFYPTKNLGALGNAGAVVTNDRNLAERVDRLRAYGWGRQFHQELPYGRNARIDEVQAAVLCVKLNHVHQWNAERRKIHGQYQAACGDDAKMVGSNDSTNACYLSVLRTPHRSDAARLMAEAGIGTSIHYPILDCDHMSEMGFPGRKLPLHESELARDQILSLPCYPYLKDAEIGRVVRVLAKVSSLAR